MRLADSNSTLQLLKVEKLHDAEIAVHIQVNSLNLKSTPEKKDSGTASHLPFSKDAIEASVTQLVVAKEHCHRILKDATKCGAKPSLKAR